MMVQANDEKVREASEIKKRIYSFRNAFRGIWTVFRFEKNFRIQFIIFLLVIVAGIVLDISVVGWIAVIIVSGLVFASECFNTAVEYLGDAITEEEDINIKKAKDVAAAGVLISAIISVITGFIVFLPAVLRFLGLRV